MSEPSGDDIPDLPEPDEGEFDFSLLEQEKYCPKCYTDDLEQVELGLEGGWTFQCTNCSGIWAMNLQQAPASAAERDLPPHDRENDLRAGLCPFAHGILRRAQSHTDERFYLERCGACSGVWFDRGEWERSARAGLLDDVHLIWTESWQTRKLDEERRLRMIAQAREVLGDEMVDELREMGIRLRHEEQRNQAIALLLEVIRGNLD